MTPDRDELARLYIDDGLTTRQIGKRFGVSKTHVLRWMRKYGIPPRPKGKGLAARGLEPMRAEDLERLVHVEHRSLAAIGALYGVDLTAVAYWLKKFGIPSSTVWMTRRGGHVPLLPTEAELREAYLVHGESIINIGRRHGVSAGPIKKLMDEHGIPRRHPGWREQRTCNDGHVVRSTYEQWVDDWLSEHGVAHVYDPRLPFDRRFRADFLANGWYIEIWGVTHNRRYTERKRWKLERYREHGMPLIELTHWAFASARKHRLEHRLAPCLTPPFSSQRDTTAEPARLPE